MKKNMWDNAGWATEKSSGATSWTSHTCLRKPMNQIAWHSCITNFKAQFPNSKKEREVQMNVWILFMCVWTSLGLFCVTDYAFYKQSQHMLYINYYKHVWLRARNEPHIFCYNCITQFSSCSKWTSHSSGIIWNKNKWWETNCQTQFWGINYQVWVINK